MRLDKFLADAGLGTRSQVKTIIRKGTITVNGVPAKKPELAGKRGPVRSVTVPGHGRPGKPVTKR